jgi:multiple sugar transport system substrate-binding protein
VGGQEGGTGSRAINWYVFNEPGGAYDQAVSECNEQANGRYQINYVKLPTDANQQRELIVRRLAAEDDSIDLVGMDVIWTAELAEAGWILPWEGEDRQAATEDKLDGPLKTVEYQGKVWGIPFTSNTQLLWYRKDLVDPPSEEITWDELIDDAASKGKGVEVQGAQYEGLTVWINSMIAGAGGQIVDQNGDVKVDESAVRAAEIERKLADSKAVPPGMATNKEDDARLGFEGDRSLYQLNYPYIYPSAAAVG